MAPASKGTALSSLITLRAIDKATTVIGRVGGAIDNFRVAHERLVKTFSDLKMQQSDLGQRIAVLKDRWIQLGASEEDAAIFTARMTYEFKMLGLGMDAVKQKAAAIQEQANHWRRLSEVMQNVTYGIMLMSSTLDPLVQKLETFTKQTVPSLVQAFGAFAGDQTMHEFSEKIRKLSNDTALTSVEITNAISGFRRYGFEATESFTMVQQAWDLATSSGIKFSQMIGGLQQVSRIIAKPETVAYLRNMGIESNNLFVMLGQLSAQWVDMDEVQRASVTTMLAGSRQAAFFQAAMASLGEDGMLAGDAIDRLASVMGTAEFAMLQTSRAAENLGFLLDDVVTAAQIRWNEALIRTMENLGGIQGPIGELIGAYAVMGPQTMQMAMSMLFLASSIDNVWAKTLGILGVFMMFIPMLQALSPPLRAFAAVVMGVAAAMIVWKVFSMSVAKNAMTTAMKATAIIGGMAVAVMGSASAMQGLAIGGTVRGPPGSPQMIMAHGGEVVMPEAGTRDISGGINITIINEGGTDTDELMEALFRELHRQGVKF